ncbi:ATP-binding cassette domain-containing protein [Micrococcus cohnii]|uniref:Putative ATPase n=1 Tax=Micrococcus cohnii TaxID=993416 RepID=A0A7W7GMR9_9MICC|nr:ATP-binding cassette domain-containing protein [Micrococcus cohnii]MBB4734966.1 putative ATPase [Micrococcus cohnii]
MELNRLPLRRVEEHPLAPLPRDRWPADVPAVTQLLETGLDLDAATVLVGPNGAGKSTLVEAIAEAFGLNPEGGTQNVRHETRRTSSELHEHLQLVRGAGAPRSGVHLRAESMYGVFTYLESVSRGPSLHRMSHGEAFLAFCRERAGVPGLWVLDEPESALSFEGCLDLLAQLRVLLESGSQVLLSTHSPVLAALPGARILAVDDRGLTETDYDELELVQHHRRFLADPQRYLRHLG